MGAKSSTQTAEIKRFLLDVCEFAIRFFTDDVFHVSECENLFSPNCSKFAVGCDRNS